MATTLADLYQIHWPARNEPAFGAVYFDPKKDKPCASIHEQLQAMAFINRSWENGLDETCHRLGVGLLAYSPLGFGLLTGKYDDGGIHKPTSAEGQQGRMALYDSMKAQRWGRPEALASTIILKTAVEKPEIA